MKHKNNNPAGTYLFKINNTPNKAMFIEFILLLCCWYWTGIFQVQMLETKQS